MTKIVVHTFLFLKKIFKMKKAILIIVSFFTALTFAQQLERKSWFGAQMDAVTKENSEKLKLKILEGLKIIKVVDKGTCQLLNLQVDDVVLTINNQKYASQVGVAKFITL